MSEIHRVCREHIEDLYGFYGTESGVRIARKHISWYTKGLVGSAAFRHAMNQLEGTTAQLAAIDEFFGRMAADNDRLAYEPESTEDETQELAA